MRRPRNQTTTILSLGLFGLALRNVLQYFLDRSGASTDMIDFGMGMLMGLSVALVLVAAARLGRERRARRPQ